MLEILGTGFLSLLLNGDVKPERLRSTNWSWLNPSLVETLTQPDPGAAAAIQQHLKGLAALGQPANMQGIWLQTGNEVLANFNGDTPLSAASLTKTATTLVALATWGPEHQFPTTVSAAGPMQNGVLQGDLIVQGGGDPFFVWENSFDLGNQLNQAGIQRVTGNLVITGNFAMNFEREPQTAGNLLKQGLNSALWNGEARSQFATLPPGTPQPRVAIEGGVQVVPASTVNAATLKPLVTYQSLDMLAILKAMNIYSNNIISEMVADELGGATAVAQKAAQLAQVPADQIQLTNGSGLGIENRLSPHAVAAILMETQRYLQQSRLNVADLYPVPGQVGDGASGTLKGRSIPNGAAVKTGTLNEVSALAGVVPTRDRGLVWFTIINYGTGDIGQFHNLQDAVLQQLQQSWGAPTSIPVAIRPSDRTLSLRKRLSAAERNQ